MIPGENTPGTNGGPRLPGGFFYEGKLGHFTASRDPTVQRGTELAGLTTHQLGNGQGGPGGWIRFLMAHVRWILFITLLVVGAAAALAHSQTPQYKSEADVNVWFATADPSGLQGPNMVTEKEMVSSGVILARASTLLGVPRSVLLQGLSVSVPASSSILQIGYSDPVPWIARVRAQVIAQAYVAYRTGNTPAPKTSTKKVAPATSLLRATLITPASLPASPSSPNTIVDILAALVVGLALSIGTAGIRDHLDDRFRGPADLETQTGAPVLALVPAHRLLTRDPAARLVAARNPDSVVAEAYRSLRTRVIDAAAARGAKILLVTSPVWEKKSTIAANLAATLAQSGRRTILVCADLRWGDANVPFGVENKNGLTRLLARRSDLGSVLRATSIPGLLVLPSGPLPRDPADVLQRGALRTVLGELRRDADFVVIDAPPVLATPDAAALARLAEMILLVGNARKSTRAHLRAALHEFEEFAGKLIGCVLYNVGRRRWLSSHPVDDAEIGPPEPDIWSRPVTVDGHESWHLLDGSPKAST